MNLTSEEIESTIVAVIEHTNQAREADKQIGCESDSPIFGPDSSLDSLGLVGFLIDLEDAFRDRGIEVSLSDERAMSQSRSPFRNVSTLTDYIRSLIDQA